MNPIRSLLTLVLCLACAACGSTGPGQRSPSAQANVSVLAQRFLIPGLQRERTLRVYLPPSYSTGQKRYPVIYMQDGQNLFDDATSFAGEWSVDEAMNALARQRGFEAIVVGIDHGGPHRNTEYNPWDNPRFGAGEGVAYVNFMLNVVKPYVDSHYRTFPGRKDTAVIGSSMGALISDYAIHRYPDVFAKAALFSPAYWVATPEVFKEAHRRRLPADARVYLYVGGQEGEEALNDAQKMYALLKEDGSPPSQGLTLHVEPAARHNEAAWRAEFERAVAWLFELK